MSYVKESQGTKKVIGTGVHTSNVNFQKEAVPLWGRFLGEGLAAKIPNRIGEGVLGVYTDYEGDYTQPFTYLVGCEVSSLDVIPEGMRGVEVPAAKYAVFTARGAFPTSMLTAWQAIWGSSLKRTYSVDFEIYPASFNPATNPEIPIYIAVDQ